MFGFTQSTLKSFFIGFLLIIHGQIEGKEVKKTHFKKFDGKNSLEYIKTQVAIGPRFITSPGHEKLQQYLMKELQKFTSDIFIQEWTYIDKSKKYQLKNIIARFAPTLEKRILLGSHYDSKNLADKDKNKKNHVLPVSGANDSASGVAILLSLAKNISEMAKLMKVGVDLVFIDGEEGVLDLTQQEWFPLGSTYLAQNIKSVYPKERPFLGLILDMVCDKDLNIYMESQSLYYAPSYVQSFWEEAKKIDAKAFIDRPKYSINDDHMPLNEIGIPSFLIIDYDYPHWHTASDTLDKCSQQSLQKVGSSVLNFLEKYLF